MINFIFTVFHGQEGVVQLIVRFGVPLAIALTDHHTRVVHVPTSTNEDVIVVPLGTILFKVKLPAQVDPLALSKFGRLSETFVRVARTFTVRVVVALFHARSEHV